MSLLPTPVSLKDRRKIVVAILEGAFPTRRFYVLLALATTIAAFGLLSNSAAVIIGAMIVAPLMGPILGLSLGMVLGRRRLQQGALVAEATGVALAVSLGYLAGCIPLNLGIGEEMLSRTSPTAYDLAIALASGLAGGYVSVNRKINSTIAGVAISVALVPPLATCGLLLAMRHWRDALSAFLLFGANFICIQLAAAVVFGLYGFARNRHPQSRRAVVVRFAPGLLALGLMAWGMTQTLVQLVRQHELDEQVRSVLSEEVARRSGGRLDKVLHREETSGTLNVVASVLTPDVFSPEQVAAIEEALGRSTGLRVRLVLRSLVSQDVDRNGRVYLSDRERQQSKAADEGAAFLNKARDVLRRSLKAVPGAELDGLERKDEDGLPSLVALVRGPTTIVPRIVGELEDGLRESLGEDLRLVVRNVETRDADRSEYLYRSEPEEKQPDPKLEAIRGLVRDALARQVALQPARSLAEARIDRRGEAVFVQATVNATLPVRPPEVVKIQKTLTGSIGLPVRLTVRTELRSEATAQGWLPPPGH